MSRAPLALLASIAIVAACSGPGTPPATSAPASASSPSSPAASTSPSSEPTARPPQTPPASAPIARTDAKGVTQVQVPAGTFLIGTDDVDPSGDLAPPDWARFELAAERPQHEVSISKAYWIDTTEVTNVDFQAFVDDGGYTTLSLWSDKGRDWLAKQDVAMLPLACESTVADHPRVCVTWFEAEAYAAWRGGALPTEAQWEFAARGPTSVVFPWGDAWDASKANVVDATATKAVGSYPEGASWIGALDMAGNAMEWVADWYSGTYYKSQERNDPTGPALGGVKVEKGGWWDAVPYVARSAYRHFEDPPTYQDHHIGFRIVSPVEP